MVKLSSPIGFTRGPVTVVATALYVAIIALLILVQTSVPSAPKSPTPVHGINLTEAWNDLQLLTGSYHPYNSRANDGVRDWLLRRIDKILEANGAPAGEEHVAAEAAVPTVVFDDTSCNLTSSVVGSFRSPGGVSAYFESTNIVVYIRGLDDDPEAWWASAGGKPAYRNGILVNAHYDSVSTGFGATDDGVGVISILQLLRYWTTPGNRPKNGLVLLLNNGEEDFLNGARAFSQHPMSKLVTSFLNLEGAGAGGRATLFRSTDAEVTRAYATSKFPFGTVISGDGFERGLVRSQTDYVVFNGVLGMRGLDVAFMEPRARYHTAQDDTRHTSVDSVWHMLSSALATTQTLTSSRPLKGDQGSPGVWFDLFGRAFALFQLHTLFALSVTLLVVAPLVLLVTMAVLYRADKLYLFSGSRKFHTREGDESMPLRGWAGFFRFPFLFLFACAGPVALAYLLFKENTFIAHSSEWAVWSMMFAAFIFVAWFVGRVAEFARPSALTRAYGFTWLFAAWWVVLIMATVLENQHHVAGTYLAFFYFAAVFVTTWLAYLELFSLPKISQYCLAKFGDDDSTAPSRSSSRDILAASGRSNGHRAVTDQAEDEEPTERSGLLGGRGRSAYKKYAQQHEEAEDDAAKPEEESHAAEQEWSKTQWSWLWLLQLLVVAPVNLILLGQVGLLLVAALHQTGADGSSMFLVYLAMAIFSILLLSPLVPFIHRFTWHVPILMLAILVATLIYNLAAFPFSPNNRLKLFFQQEVDLHTGENAVSLLGATPFVQDAIRTLPSAAGQSLHCTALDAGRAKCSWPGIPPNVVSPHSTSPPEVRYPSWLEYNVSASLDDPTAATFTVHGLNTKACKLVFDTPVHAVQIHGSSVNDQRFPPVPEGGSKEVRLWSRTWSRTWTVDVGWGEDDMASGQTGRVVCLWSDVNERGVIPAFDEARHYAPDWVAITKAADGLVEGFKPFSVP